MTLRESGEAAKSFRLKCLIVLLLLISGNVQPNPGTDNHAGFKTPADLKEGSGLGFLHLRILQGSVLYPSSRCDKDCDKTQANNYDISLAEQFQIHE